LAVGLLLPVTHVRIAFFPALGSSGSAVIVTWEGLKRTDSVMLDLSGPLVAGFEASHLQNKQGS